MTALRHVNDTDVTQKVQEAAQAACGKLDELFPGFDNGGISSNFQGLLVEALTHMLTGRSLLDASRGHLTQLPELVVSDAFFGSPMIRGEMFLVTKRADCPNRGEGKGDLVALDPDNGHFRPLSAIGDAHTSFEYALTYLRVSGFTLEQARKLGLKVQPVEFDKSRETGFVLTEIAHRVAA
jgi:hypothetical protein